MLNGMKNIKQATYLYFKKYTFVSSASYFCKSVVCFDLLEYCGYCNSLNQPVSNRDQEMTMSKERNSSREAMKKPAMSLKEKRAAKQAKKGGKSDFMAPAKSKS